MGGRGGRGGEEGRRGETERRYWGVGGDVWQKFQISVSDLISTFDHFDLSIMCVGGESAIYLIFRTS